MAHKQSQDQARNVWQEIDLASCKLPSRAKIAGISDTHTKQVCGVTKSIEQMSPLIEAAGFEFDFKQATAKKRYAFPLGKSGAWLTWNPKYLSRIIKNLEKLNPEAVHVFTEGTIGLAVKSYLQQNDIKHTSSFHTVWPNYFVAFANRHVSFNQAPALDLLWQVYEKFHASSEVVMTRSDFLRDQLESKGFKNVVVWNGGVDLKKFNPDGEIHSKLIKLRSTTNKPILLYLGRVSDEKNIKAYLDLKLDALKLVVGPITPYAKKLQADYRSDENIIFFGAVEHGKLASVIRGADVMVFPSKTDTFGLVNVEALACGIPVVGFRDTCLKDIISHQTTGILADKPEELNEAVLDALTLAKNEATRDLCFNRASQFSIPKVTSQFLNNLVRIKD